MGVQYEKRIGEIIKEHVNIVDLISEYVQLKKTGRNFKGLCPFHNEKTASFSVSEDKQFYHCFGCGASGDAIKFVQDVENLDFVDALEFLAEKYGVDLSAYEVRGKSNFGSNTSLEVRKKLIELNRSAAISYYKMLPRSQDAVDYLKKRGLNQETIRTFGLGFAPDNWHFIHYGLGKQADVDTLVKAGLVGRNEKGNVYDYFRNRIMFPIKNSKGQVIAFGGRVMGDGVPKYLNSPETEIFHKSTTLYGLDLAKKVLHEKRQVIVTEGYMDVIALHQNGVRNAVATLGTSLTSEHGRLLSRYADEIVICYDGDSAGQKAAFRSLDTLSEAKAKVKILTLKDGLDPDEFIRSNGKEAFEKQLENALLGVEYKLSVVEKTVDLTTSEGKSDFSNQAIAIISSLKNAMDREIYAKYAAQKANLDWRHLLQTLEKQVAETTGQSGNPLRVSHNPIKKEISNRRKSPLWLVEKRLLEIALTGEKGYKKIMGQMENIDLQYEQIRSIFVFLREYYKDHDIFDPELASEQLELKTVLGLNRLTEKAVPVENLPKEVLTIINKHKELVIKKRLEEKKIEIQEILNQGEAEGQAPTQVIRRLVKEQQALIHDLKDHLKNEINP